MCKYILYLYSVTWLMFYIKHSCVFLYSGNSQAACSSQGILGVVVLQLQGGNHYGIAWCGLVCSLSRQVYSKLVSLLPLLFMNIYSVYHSALWWSEVYVPRVKAPPPSACQKYIPWVISPSAGQKYLFPELWLLPFLGTNIYSPCYSALCWSEYIFPVL